jgi:hypothetical protein
MLLIDNILAIVHGNVSWYSRMDEFLINPVDDQTSVSAVFFSYLHGGVSDHLFTEKIVYFTIFVYYTSMGNEILSIVVKVE